MFLVFLKHAQGHDELVLPVAAQTRAEAEQQAAAQYPAHTVLTCYSAQALQQLLADFPDTATAAPAPARPLTAADRRAEVMTRLAKTRRQTMLEAMQVPPTTPDAATRTQPMISASAVKNNSVAASSFTVGMMPSSHDSVNVYTQEAQAVPAVPSPSLKEALALLRQQGGCGVDAAVELRQEAPVDAAPISRNPAAAAQAAQPKIQRQPAVAAGAPMIARAPQSVIEVFKGLKR